MAGIPLAICYENPLISLNMDLVLARCTDSLFYQSPLVEYLRSQLGLFIYHNEQVFSGAPQNLVLESDIETWATDGSGIWVRGLINRR